MTAVSELKQKLEAAVAEEARQKRAYAARKVEALSAEGERLTAQLEPMAVNLNNDQNLQLRLHAELVQARDQINAHSAPLDPLSFPSRTAERNRLRNLAEWKERQRGLLLKHHDCVRRQSIRPQAMALQRRLEQLKYEIQNWSTIAEGGKIGEVTGGAFANVENFL
jgi:hypothetical protein